MSDKSNKFGYVGADIPAQSFGNNKGVFNIAEINELVADNKWTTFGQIELINSFTADGSSSSLIINNIKENIYDVHLLLSHGFYVVSNNIHINARFSNDNGSTLITSANYDKAAYYGNTAGNDQGQSRYSGDTDFEYFMGTDNSTSTKTGGAYHYLYNLGNSSKYSSWTSGQYSHNVNNTKDYYTIQTGVLEISEVHNAIGLISSNGSSNIAGNFSLYGIRYS